MEEMDIMVNDFFNYLDDVVLGVKQEFYKESKGDE